MINVSLNVELKGSSRKDIVLTDENGTLTDLPFDYDKEQAVADGVYVNIHGYEIYNQELVDAFYTNVLNGSAAFMRTFGFTDEGDSLIRIIIFRFVEIRNLLFYAVVGK